MCIKIRVGYTLLCLKLYSKLSRDGEPERTLLSSWSKNWRQCLVQTTGSINGRFYACSFSCLTSCVYNRWPHMKKLRKRILFQSFRPFCRLFTPYKWIAEPLLSWLWSCSAREQRQKNSSVQKELNEGDLLKRTKSQEIPPFLIAKR